MKKMSRILMIFVTLLLATSLGFAQGQVESAGKGELPDEITIALAAPFTGLGSILGKDISQGANLAVEEINASGGISGSKLKITIYDTKANASVASTVVRKALFEDGVVAIYGPNMSSAVIGVHTMAKDAATPMLVGATSPTFRFTNVGNPYLFRLRADDGVKVAMQIKYAVENLGMKKPAIIYGSTDYCTAALKVAEDAFASYGIDIVAKEQVREGDKDATGQILNMRQAGFDGLIGLTHEPEASIIVTQVKQMGIDVPIIGFSAWGVPSFTDLAGKAAVGVYSVQGFNSSDDDPVVQEFVSRYQDRWGERPSDPAQCYYDGMFVLKAAIEKAGTVEGEALAKALDEVEYMGVQGRMKSDEHHNFTSLSYIAQFDGSEWKIIDKLQ